MGWYNHCLVIWHNFEPSWPTIWFEEIRHKFQCSRTNNWRLLSVCVDIIEDCRRLVTVQGDGILAGFVLGFFVYCDSHARKVRDAENPVESFTGGATVVPRPVAPPTSPEAIAGAGGIGLATRNPEFESMDNLDSPRSRDSARSFSTDASEHEINTAAAGASEKGKSLKPWQVWMRKRLWGIVPYWAIGMTLAVLLVMTAILGSVIGTFMAKRYRSGSKDGFS